MKSSVLGRAGDRDGDRNRVGGGDRNRGRNGDRVRDWGRIRLVDGGRSMGDLCMVFVLDLRERTKTVAAKPKAKTDIHTAGPSCRELRPGKPLSPNQ